ncbi:MAG: tetratricopeptide repeat protein [Cyanobacteria bacterium J007]|nr:MAG: tetratricopeptide repeat protein [Cyanobacteria bacterium J007]
MRINQTGVGVEIASDRAIADLERAEQFQRQENWDAAIACYRRALTHTGDPGEIYPHLAAVYLDAGQYPEAIATCQQALKRDPNRAELYHTLAIALDALDRPDAATRAYDRALDAWQQALQLPLRGTGGDRAFKLGNALLASGRLDAAICAYQRAIALQPQSAEAHSNLGIAWLQAGRGDRAVAALRRARALQPQSAGIAYNLAKALDAQLRRGDASADPQLSRQRFEALLDAVKLAPEFAEAHEMLLGTVISPQPQSASFSLLREIAAAYLRLCPPSWRSLALVGSVSVHLYSGTIPEAQAQLGELETEIYQNLGRLPDRFIRNLYSQVLFCLPHLRDDRGANSRLATFMGDRVRGVLDRQLQEPVATAKWANARPAPLKIGCLSAHFRRHSVGWCSRDVLRELSRICPDLYLYSSQAVAGDDLTREFQQFAAKFYQPSRRGEAVIAEIFDEMRRDRLDILIDLDSSTVSVHPEILYRHPAPICLSWLGFDAPYLDDRHYFLADWHTHPAGAERDYPEKLLRMPACFMAVGGFEARGFAESRPWGDRLVYLCVAPGKKLDRALVDAQIQILKQVPYSILLHKGQGDLEIIQEAYGEGCDRHRVERDRVQFLPQTETEEAHRAIYKTVDVLLDSYPYNGGTHNLEALYFELPVVTRVGEQFLSRMAYSFLKTLGIEAGISPTWEDYIDWGIKLGSDRELRAEIRQKLRRSRQPETLSPLWNPEKFARDLYEILLKIAR